MQTYLPINEIKLINRQRLDLGVLTSLIESITQHGIIQPIIVNQEKVLIAGGRRLAAATQLKWEQVPVVYRETLSQDELHILELEENLRRKQETWQENCLHITTIHRLKQKAKALDSLTWGQRETAELLGVDSVREVNHAIKMALLLESELDSNKQPLPNARYWKCETISDAFRLYFRDEEDRGLAEQARRQAERTSTLAPTLIEETVDLSEFDYIETVDDPLAKERARYYANPHNPPDSFDSYWEEREKRKLLAAQTIYLSSQLKNVDCIKFMHENAGRFDHVITDIPYGIDLDMISQSNNTFNDIDTVEELHKVDYNLKLIADFFPAAYAALGDKGFCITWCDQMLWQYMYDHAVAAGFAVQRWPIIWHKNSAMNSCVSYNTTKDIEIAIVCRKKQTILMAQPQTSVVSCGKDELSNSIGHPFAKPFECWRFLIEMATLKNQLILEPFAGRGSGVISMLKLERNVVGCELDTTHFNALLENVKQLHYLPLNPNYIFV